MSEEPGGAVASEPPGIGGLLPEVPARSTHAMAALTAVSRMTGFIRVAVVTNVLGVTYLANTYQTANTIPNILFELLAAGALQAVLVPAIVGLVDQGDDAESRRVVGAVLGLTSAALAAVAVVGMIAGPVLMRVMVRDVGDAAIRAQEVRLGTFFLWFFLPQVVLYGANTVATAVLNATGSFGLPAVAPAVNNVVVVGVYLTFAAMRGGRPPTLDITTAEKVLLAGGTTLGVVLFCALPVAVANRRVPLRPNLDIGHPRIRALARLGGWAVVYLGITQVLLVVLLQLTNRREGAVAVYQLAFVVFMMPHSLFSVPVLTTRFPTLARLRLVREWRGFATTVAEGIRSILFVSIGASALLIALAEPTARALVHGRTVARVGEIASAIVGFSPGLAGIGLFLFFTRVSYAYDDTRTPALANLAATSCGVVAMVAVAGWVAPVRLVAGLGLAYGATQTLAALLLAWAVRRRVRDEGTRIPSTMLPLGRDLVAGISAALVADEVARHTGSAGVVHSLLTLAVAGAAGLAVYLVAQAVLGGPMPIAALRSFGAAERNAPRTEPR